MKATLVHNPSAGMGDHTKEDLIELLTNKGFEVEYISSKNKDFEKSLQHSEDLIIVAGGDGTIAKVSTLMLEKDVPVAILALGTANNIAYTMQSCKQPEEQVEAWNLSKPSDFDTGVIKGSWGKEIFFESVGFGIFPKLIKESKRRQENLKEDFKSREEKISFSLDVLKEIVADIAVSSYEIKIDENEVISGNFLAVEVMNIKSVGPNIFLAPDADPSDNTFDLVLITDNDRASFIHYVDSLLNGEIPEDIRYRFKRRKASKIEIFTHSELIHIDDEKEEINTATKVQIEIGKAKLKFV